MWRTIRGGNHRRVVGLVAVAIVVLGCLGQGGVAGDEPRFRTHILNADAEYGACAVLDVDQDGNADIFSGGWWYRGPDWKRVAAREVEQIRGRFDDYSNLPFDVDADGWVDIISCNYRSQSLYWVRNPAGKPEPWIKTVIDTPGPMETGRLADVNADGRTDLLPNGTTFAAWWSRSTTAGEMWTRHPLPQLAAGHGIGLGDINADGRPDVVSTQGWCQAADDGTWIPHQDFRLHADAGLPILVFDVDGDGDTDIVWGRGHRTGLYWLEQLSGATRAWRQHTIDTSWSQSHSLLLADIDGDGREELIAGKRYLGHDGRDLGEYDPLGIYWYKFLPDLRSWKRGVVSDHPRAGFGLDPKAADVDGDGDIDVIAADRTGLYLCENLLVSTGSAVEQVAAPDVAVDHQRVLLYGDGGGRAPLQPLESALGWGRRRAAILAGMQQAMGPVPDPSRRVPLDVEIVEQHTTAKYTRTRLRYVAEPGDRVPGYLLVPHGLTSRAPAMLCLHQTTAIGKDEPAGLGGKENLHYAHELAERGFVCLVPDYPSFGEYPFDFSAAAERYGSGSMKAIWNNMRAVDLLESLPDVDPDRIGCIGHSLGGHNTLFTAAMDLRIRAAVTSCGFTAFHHYYAGKLAGWTSDRYMPRIRERYGNDPDRVPFDFYEVLAAIAPRSVFVCAPLHDSNFDVEGVRKVEREVNGVYQLLSAEGQVQYVYPDAGHDFPLEQRQQAYAWLEQKLAGR
jgi:acetyl esterase/lipase